MSLPTLDLQRTFFEPEILFPGLGKAPGAERFSFFAERILPELMKRRPELEKMYCADNGRPADEPAFHPTSLVKFRERLLAHGLEQLGFAAVLEQMSEAGYLAKRSRQRLDSTHIIGLVSQMSRLECVRQTLRLALEELAQIEKLPRPAEWTLWWERYVESSIDYRSSGDIIRLKMPQAGLDARNALNWITDLPESVRQGKAVRLLERVFNENFEAAADGTVEKLPMRPGGAVQNPHDPDAQWSSKETLTEKTWVGHKVQVAETVAEEPRKTGEPTKNVITAIVTQNAIASDKAGMAAVFDEQKQLGLEKPEILYADGAYVSGPSMAQARSESRELMGPTIPSPNRGVYTADAFHVDVERRYAICPSGKASTQCARMEAGKTGRITYRFEWCGLCQSCAVKEACLHKGDRYRVLQVTGHHTLRQARRKLMHTEEFKKDMHHRNGIEGTQSELVRGYGLRQARYRGNQEK